MVDPKNLKELVEKKFHPIYQHDSQEFMMYILSNL